MKGAVSSAGAEWSARAHRERGRPTVRGLFIDEETPCESLTAGQRQCPEVDPQWDPQFAAGSDSRWPSRFELSVEADRLVANGHGVAVLVGEIESPLVFDVGLIPRHGDSDRDGHLLGTGADHAQAATEDEELAIVHLHSVSHQDDRPEGRWVEREVRLIHYTDPIGPYSSNENRS